MDVVLHQRALMAGYGLIASMMKGSKLPSMFTRGMAAAATGDGI